MEAILREAAGCFNRNGYHGTTIEDIANRLNVTKAALYHYVANKEEILYTCHRLALDIGMEALQLAQGSKTKADEKLKIVLRHYIEGVTNTLRGAVVLLEEGNLTPRHYREVVKQRDTFEHGVRMLVRDGIAEGIFGKRDPKIVVFAMLGAANWIFKWYSPEGNLSSEDIAKAFAEYLVDGLRFPASVPASKKVGKRPGKR